MPISSDRFDSLSDDDEEPTPGTNAATILAFLREHSDEAFTQSEIAAATDVTTGSVGPTLVRLRERGRVDHRGVYWRASDHDRSLAAAAGHASETAAASEDETPAFETWRRHAADPREHRDG